MLTALGLVSALTVLFALVVLGLSVISWPFAHQYRGRRLKDVMYEDPFGASFYLFLLWRVPAAIIGLFAASVFGLCILVDNLVSH